MKIEIKHRYTGEVLFKHECDNNTIKITLEAAVKAGAYLGYADLRGAYLVDADLIGGNLGYADLRCADLGGVDLSAVCLRGADLGGADLRYAIGNGSEIMSAQVGEYRIVYTSEDMWIGCRKHPVDTWWKDSEKDWDDFCYDDMEWRKRNKKWIKKMVKANPATPFKKITGDK